MCSKHFNLRQSQIMRKILNYVCLNCLAKWFEKKLKVFEIFETSNPGLLRVHIENYVKFQVVVFAGLFTS